MAADSPERMPQGRSPFLRPVRPAESGRAGSVSGPDLPGGPARPSAERMENRADARAENGGVLPPVSAGTDPEFPFRPSGFSERSDHGAGPERSGKSGPPEHPEPDRSNRGRTRGKSAIRSGVPDSRGAAETDAGNPSVPFPVLKNERAFCQKGET